MNEIVVLGDRQMGEVLRQALSKQSMFVLNTDEMEIQDEWSVRRWFSRNTPHGVFLCIGLQGQTNVANFMFTVAGALNVIRAAIGNVKRLIMVSQFPSAEFFLFQRLIYLLQWEKQIDFYTLLPGKREGLTEFLDRCVLSMRDVSAQEANQKGTEGPEQGREVRAQVLSQPESGQQHGSPAEPVLEVPVEAAEAAPPGDLRAQRAPAEGQEATGSANHNAGPV